MRFVLLGLLVLPVAACKTRLYDLSEAGLPPTGDLRAAPPDLTPPPDLFAWPDLTPPPDLAVPPDFTPPPDLTPPHYCDGIFVFDVDRRLSFFDPRRLTFTDIATLACPAPPNAQPFSMAVRRDGNAWVEYDDGELFLVDTYTGACQPTAFAVNQQGFNTFGMGFAADAPGSPMETLFVAHDGANMPELGRIDLQSLQLTRISALPGDAELTGTGSGELWGFFGEVNAHAGRIDKVTGAIVEDVPLPQVGDATQSGFAFGNFAGDFWVFIYDMGSSTRVYRLQRPGNVVTLPLANTGRHIVGAGVSTCAPGMGG
jgi:hypothetical protein